MATKNSNRGVKSTSPPIHTGAFWVTVNAATAASEPSTGRGAVEGSPSTSALWDDLGLTAGTFTVLLESIVLNAATTLLTVTELHADASVVQFNVTPGAHINIPMRDGFTFATAGGGCAITFRIQKHYE